MQKRFLTLAAASLLAPRAGPTEGRRKPNRRKTRYTQGNEAVKPIFTAWLQPFAEMGATTVTSRNTGSTDHVAFDAVSLPGFQFIQDGLDYFARTHHSNQDTYDRFVADDLKQASVVVASFVYNAAMRDQRLPRKPLLAAVKPQ